MSWQQLRPTLARLGLPSSPPAEREEKGAEREPAGVGLGERPEHCSALKVAHVQGAAGMMLLGRVLRRNGEGYEESSIFLAFLLRCFLLVDRSRAGLCVGGGGSGCVQRSSTVAVWRGNKGSVCKPFGFLQLLQVSQSLTELDPGPRNLRKLWAFALLTRSELGVHWQTTARGASTPFHTQITSCSLLPV